MYTNAQVELDKLIRSGPEVRKLFPWLEEDEIRAIPHFISPAWNRDRSSYDPEYYAECWQRMGVQTVTLLTVHHDGHYLYPSNFCLQKPDRDYFGEQVEACRKRDIRVLAYYSLTLNSLAGSEHPDWRARTLDGRVVLPSYDDGCFAHYHWMCVNSPFGDFAVSQLDELVSRYDIEGVWLDIPYLPARQNNNDDSCFCNSCHQAYSNWYEGQHLLDAAHTARHSEFKAESYRHFLIKLKSMLLSKDRPLLLSFNGAGQTTRCSYERIDELADYLCCEAHNPLSLCLFSKHFRNSGRPFELMSCSEVCWSHNQSKPDTLIKLESLATRIVGGTYTIGINHAPDGRLQEANIQRLYDWSAWLRARGELFAGTEPVYELAVYGRKAHGNEASLLHDEWGMVLRKGHFLFNVVTDKDRMQDYKLVVLPAGTAVSNADKDCLESYVRNGGTLFIEGPAARIESDGPFVMEELMGVSPAGRYNEYGFYLLPAAADLSYGLMAGEPVFIRKNEASRLQLAGAVNLCHLVRQFKDKKRTSDIQTVPNYAALPSQLPMDPGITLNEYYQGRVMTTALSMVIEDKDASHSPWREMLVNNCISFLLGKPAVRIRGYSRVEVLACRKGDSLILHFLNHEYGGSEYIHGYGECEKYKDIRVELSDELSTGISRITTEPDGEELEMAGKAGNYGFVLSELSLYRAVVLHGC